MKKSAAFTLVELLITVTIFGILAGIAAPSYISWVQDSAMVNNTNNLIGALQLARSEAIKRDGRVSVCQSADANTAATPSCAGTGQWEDGWVVWADENGNNVVDSSEDIIRVADQATGANVTMRGTATVANVISFDASGLPVDTSGNNYTGTVRICDDRGLTTLDNGKTDARAVVILASGRIRSTNNKAAVGSCP